MESKEEEREDMGLSSTGVAWRKIAGSELTFSKGMMSKSKMVDGRDSRSASSFTNALDGMDEVLERTEGKVVAFREDVRVVMENEGEWWPLDVLGLRGSWWNCSFGDVRGWPEDDCVEMEKLGKWRLLDVMGLVGLMGLDRGCDVGAVPDGRDDNCVVMEKVD